MKIKLFLRVMRKTGILKMLLMFILLFFISALIIMLVEPDINNFLDALWYTFVASTSIGFGDICPQTHIGRIITVIITIYEILIAAMLTGVMLTFYVEYIRIKEKQSIESFYEQLEKLPELTKDELSRLSAKIKEDFNKNR